MVYSPPRPDDARQLLDALLAQHPDDVEALKLLQTL